MEDKQFLDEAGLGEVGKVISKFYASKDDIKDLDGLKDFVGSHNEIKLHYITKEEYAKMEGSGEFPRLLDIHDPISIVGIEYSANNSNLWGDDPWARQWELGLTPDMFVNDGVQKYLLLNITPNNKIISDRIDKVDFNGSPLKDSDVRLQIAFGEKDCCLYWRLLHDNGDGISWTFIKDPCATQWIDNIQKQYKALQKQMNDKVEKKDGYGLSQNNFTNELLDKVNNIPETHLTIERFPDKGDLYAVDKEGLYIVNVKTTNAPSLGNVAIWEQEAWYERKEYPLMAGYYALLVVFFEGDKKHLLLYDTLTSSAWEAHVPKDYVTKENNGSGGPYFWKQHGNIGFNADDVVNLIQKIPQGFTFNPNGYGSNSLSLSDELLETVTLTYDENIVNVTLRSKDGETEQSGTFLLGATETSAGVMSASDKKKLNSIDIEKYAQQEKDIKSMEEEIALLKSQIEKLQASVNSKE